MPWPWVHHVTWRFVGNEAHLLFPDGHSIVLDEFGQRIELTPEERVLFAGVPLLPDAAFDGMFTAHELSAYPSPQAAQSAPAEYWTRRIKVSALASDAIRRYHQTGCFE